MKHLVLGVGKSGTTILYTIIRKAIPKLDADIFEPKDLPELKEADNAVVKMLVDHFSETDGKQLLNYHKRYLIVRDFRDIFVSRLLYRTRDTVLVDDQKKRNTFLDLIEAKQRKPRSVSVMQIAELFTDLTGEDIYSHLCGMARKLDSVLRQYGELFFIVKYEDFVGGTDLGLSEYAGFSIDMNVDVDIKYSRVTRTKGSGSWRHWFLAEDLTIIRNDIGGILASMGYQDWNLAEEQRIEEAHSIDYVRKIIDQRNANKKNI